MSTTNLGAVTAYGIARKNGYTGTEAEWLASLKGEKGDTGATGAAGHSPTVTATKSGKVTTISVDGTAIATVNDGADGEKGEKGDTGDSGVVSATAPLAYDATNKKLSISAASTSAAGTMSATDKSRLDMVWSVVDTSTGKLLPSAIPTATTTALGGIKVGDGLMISTGGVLAVNYDAVLAALPAAEDGSV